MAVATCIATRFERRRPLPVDSIIPNPLFTSTHAITIDVPPGQVWPWIAQMGAGRAGWYSWDAIDNGGTPSATRVVSEFQTVVPGDVMPAVPHAKDAFVVASVDPPRDLVLTVPDGHGGNAVAWEHVLDPVAGGRTRLIVRGRASSDWLDLARTQPPAGHRRIFIERAYAVLAHLPRPLLIGVAAAGHRVMEARHLRGIQRRSTASGHGGSRTATANRWVRSVRATPQEKTCALPGDALIENPIGSLQHAITIRRPRHEVWPWLAQMGAGSRAGWYSYDFLDNGRQPSATRIIPELQPLAVGMIFPAGPGVADGFTLLAFEPTRFLVLGWTAPDGGHVMTWAFVLEEAEHDSTRLLVRVRVRPGARIAGLPWWAAKYVVRAIHFVMQRKQLIEMGRRAEHPGNVETRGPQERQDAA